VTAHFSAHVGYEGSKRGPGASFRIALPAHLRTLDGTFQAPGWLRVTINRSAPFFAYARRPPSRTTVEVTLPHWCGVQVAHGDVVQVTCASAEPFRATNAQPGFDWLPHFAQDDYLPIDQDGLLVVHTRYSSPFEITRAPAPLPTYRMLGLYQAEGSKSEDAPDFSLGNSNPFLLAHTVELLGAWGLPPARLSLEILREPGTHPSVARALFQPLGVEIVAERVRTGAGTHAATLHVRKSQPLLRAVKAALAEVFAHGFPSQEAAREYALGWLDGDGSITICGSVLELRLAGQEEEQRVTFDALHRGFGWTVHRGKYGGQRHHTARTIHIREAAELALAGGFSFSMSRARLLYELERRCAATRRRITEADYDQAQVLLKQLQPEIETLRRILPPERVPVGIKGLPYPLKKFR
jgi:hypothetical protein